MGRPPWGLPRCTVTRAEKFGAFLGCTNKFWFLLIMGDLCRRSASGIVDGGKIGRTVGALYVRLWARCMGPPTPQKLTTRERARAFWLGWSAAAYVRILYARLQGPPHIIQACLFGVRWSLSNRPFICRLTLSACRNWVCLGLFVFPSWSQCLGHFIQSLVRSMAAKLTPKGPLPPFGCKKTSKKNKKKPFDRLFVVVLSGFLSYFWV